MKKISTLLAGLFLIIQLIHSQTTPDPGLTGPFAVTKAYYNYGDLAYKPAGFPDSVEVAGSVHYPTGLAGGPYPVLLFMHGRHSTAYETADPSNSTSDWPPPAGFQSIVSFEGYDFLAQHMASHGYIVVSISVNAINATDNGTPDSGMQGRAELAQHHLDRWNTFNTTGAAPFDSLFIGKLDMTNIGTMGHSRGGEGVVRHAVHNASLGSPYGINAVLTLAPVNFQRTIFNDIPLMNIAPYCDGDVSDLQGVHYYDDVRYNDSGDVAPKYSVLMMGANHNFFNTVWTPGLYPAGTADDWDDIYGDNANYCGSADGATNRFSPTEQQGALITYASAFFRTHIGGETDFLPILKTEDIIPPVSSLADSNDIFVSYHPPLTERLDFNRITLESNENINTVGDTVIANSLSPYDVCADDNGEADCGLSIFPSKEPHAGTSGELGIGQLRMGWNAATDYFENNIPVSYQNFSGFSHLQFRAAIEFGSATSGTDANFTVQLVDYAGDTAGVFVDNYTNALFLPPGDQFLQLPKLMYNTIKIPLADFSGVDLTQIQKVRFVFDQSPAGEIFITEMMAGGVVPPTAVSKLEPEIDFAAFPNPFNNEITIRFNSDNPIVARLKIYSVEGKSIGEYKIQSGINTTISTNGLVSGIYFLQLNTVEGSKTLKLIRN